MDIDPPSEPTPIDDVSTTIPRRSTRISHPSKRNGFLHDNEQELFVHKEVAYDGDPMTYEKAISDIDSLKWIEDMKSKMDSMYKNQVWDLVDPPEGIVPIGNK